MAIYSNNNIYSIRYKKVKNRTVIEKIEIVVGTTIFLFIGAILAVLLFTKIVTYLVDPVPKNIGLSTTKTC